MKYQTNLFLQLLVYCILTSVNPMMDFLLMQSAQLFLNAAQYFVNGVNVLFPRIVADINVFFLYVGIGRIPFAAEIVCVLMVAWLLLYFRGHYLYLFVVLMAVVVYNNEEMLLDFLLRAFAEETISMIDENGKIKVCLDPFCKLYCLDPLNCIPVEN